MEDLVKLMSALHIWKKNMNKRCHKCLFQWHDSPFEVIKKVMAVAYQLTLPNRMKIHLNSHISFIKPIHRDDEHPECSKVKKAPLTVRKELDKKVEHILDH